MLKDRCPSVPHFPDSAGVKVPAAWLVEQAGFHKGLQRGRRGYLGATCAGLSQSRRHDSRSPRFSW